MSKKKKPKNLKLPLRCEKCGHEWEEVCQQHIIAEAFVKRFTGLLCVNCGAKPKHIVLRSKKVSVTMQGVPIRKAPKEGQQVLF